MSFIRKSIDAVNKSMQFEVSETCQGVNLKFNPEFVSADGLQIRVEKISRNTANQVLYSGVLSDLKSLFKVGIPNMQNVLPFALGKNLMLSEDDKILVTIDYDLEVADAPTSFEYELNKFADDTNNPLVVKKVVIDEETSFDTEFYPLLLIPKTADSFETIVQKRNASQQVENKKVFYGKNLINSMIKDGGNFLAVTVNASQSVTIKGNATAYLILS